MHLPGLILRMGCWELQHLRSAVVVAAAAGAEHSAEEPYSQTRQYTFAPDASNVEYASEAKMKIKIKSVNQAFKLIDTIKRLNKVKKKRLKILRREG